MKKITHILPILLGYLLSTVPCHAYRDLETGVFLSRDPAGFVDGPNVYTYVDQNPWTAFDPEGLQKATAEDRVAIQTGHAPMILGDVENHVKFSNSDNGAVHYMGGKGDVAPANAVEARASEVVASGGHPENIMALVKSTGGSPFASMAANAALIRAGAEATNFEKACAEATPFLAAVGGGMFMPKGGGLMTQDSSPVNKSARNVSETNVAETPGVVYRGGDKSPSNLTPRPVDEGMLSTRDSLSNPWPLQPGQKPPLPAGKPIQVIDTQKLPGGGRSS